MFWAGFATGIGVTVVAGGICYIGFNIWVAGLIR